MHVKHKSIALFTLSLLAYFVTGCALQEDESSQMLPLLPPSECPVYDYKLITIDTPIPLSVAREMVGLTDNKAALCAASLNWGFRVAERDGEYLSVTMDYRADRVSVIVNKGIVTGVDVG